MSRSMRRALLKAAEGSGPWRMRSSSSARSAWSLRHLSEVSSTSHSSASDDPGSRSARLSNSSTTAQAAAACREPEPYSRVAAVACSRASSRVAAALVVSRSSCEKPGRAEAALMTGAEDAGAGLGRTGMLARADMPPSKVRVCPVSHGASNKNNAASATSSTEPYPSGRCGFQSDAVSVSACFDRSVGTGPGARPRTRTSGAHSKASVAVSESRAALEAPYADMYSTDFWPCTDDIMRTRVAFRRFAATAKR
mmetsp:Transcript_16089/g.48704  ORF Transcript_16089/g.48704 Transcript_16089/m.48704 type:complete len:253 (+) Transcript_16089:901-1659(+)